MNESRQEFHRAEAITMNYLPNLYASFFAGGNFCSNQSMVEAGCLKRHWVFHRILENSTRDMPGISSSQLATL